MIEHSTGIGLRFCLGSAYSTQETGRIVHNGSAGCGTIDFREDNDIKETMRWLYVLILGREPWKLVFLMSVCVGGGDLPYREPHAITTIYTTPSTANYKIEQAHLGATCSVSF